MERYQVTPLAGFDATIGGWLWAMEETGKRTLRLLQNEALDQRLLDWESPEPNENAIGSLLYHIAEVEMGWLLGNIKGLAQMPPDIPPDFPFESGYEVMGRITSVPGVPLAEYLARLDRIQEVFLKEVRGLTATEWRTLKPGADK